MNPPTKVEMTFGSPLAAICRMANGSWAAEIAPNRLLIGRSREEAMGLFMFDLMAKAMGRELRDDEFRVFDLSKPFKKGGGA